MKKIFFVCIAIIVTTAVGAQKSSTAPAMPDVNKLKNMKPAELEAYKQQMLNQLSKQARTVAAKNNIKINEAALPDFELKMPVKDIKRLSLLPVQPPTLIQLADGLKQTKKQLESVTPKAILDEVKTITAQQTPAEMQGSSIGEFYSDKPVQALLISMQSALQNMHEAASWNNLAALFNMSGLEHKAIPILMNQLQHLPGNSMLLNNMGQAYLGLGDIAASKNYLQQCLAEDPLNPEANRSMGMICLFQKQFDESKQYFEKELEVTQRQSTRSLIKKNGFDINIYSLRKKNTGIPNKNFFGEIQLGKFRVPEFPATCFDSRAMEDKHSGFRLSVTQEILYWREKGNASPQTLAAEGKQGNGIYSGLVKDLLEDLHKIYTSEKLALFDDIQLNQIKTMVDAYGTQIAAIQCETPPVNASQAVILAYQQKCCEKKKVAIDEYLTHYNNFVSMHISTIAPVWKDYLNDLINIVSLDPTSANKRYVCQVISEYFTFLAIASTSGVFTDPPMECYTKMTAAEADSVIQSSRDVDLSCPSWLNIEFDAHYAKIKADCSKYAIEGGELFRGEFEHNFKTGTSTLAGGLGVKAKFFAGAGGVDMKQMVYVSWDNNNNFTDLGIKGKASVKIGDNPIRVADGIGKIGGTVAGVEAGYTYGLNSGFNSSVKGKGIIADFIKIDKSL
jgi:tetratricopeptide (TPR) repeat protein